MKTLHAGCLTGFWICIFPLTHFRPILPFYFPWKHKNHRYKNRILTWNVYMLLLWTFLSEIVTRHLYERKSKRYLWFFIKILSTKVLNLMLIKAVIVQLVFSTYLVALFLSTFWPLTLHPIFSITWRLEILQFNYIWILDISIHFICPSSTR